MRAIDGPLLPLALAALAALGALAPDLPREDRRREPELRFDAAPILGGLERGDDVAGWSVRGVEAGEDGRIRVTLGRDEVTFSVLVTPTGAEPHPPPAATATRDVFYERVRPEGASITDADRDAILAAIVEHVRAHE